MPDYPDFTPAVSPLPATYVTTLGPFAAGASWGPVAVQLPAGGSYHLTLRPTVLSNYCCTDMFVGHFDTRGVASYQDYYGGVLFGQGGGGSFASCGAAIIRGNLYGVSLQLSGSTCATAFLNAVMPSGGFTATGFSIDVYVTPFALPDPQPKVTVTSPNLHSFVSDTPQTALGVMNDTAVAASSTTFAEPVMAYAGPAVLEITQTGIAAAANAQLLISEYTVANGSATPWARRRVKGLASGQYAVFPLSLAPLLRTFAFVNADPANAATVDMLLTGVHAA